MPLVPDYSSRTTPRVTRGLFGWVRFCALAPMVGGVGIFLLYAMTRSEWLPVAGVWALGIGLALVILGFGLLAWYNRQQSRANLIVPDALHIRVRRAIWLLTANFAVAILCVVLGVREMHRRFFTVTNTSTSVMQDVRVVLTDRRQLNFGAVQPGQSSKRSMVLAEDPRPTLIATVNGQRIEQTWVYWDWLLLPSRGNDWKYSFRFDGKTVGSD